MKRRDKIRREVDARTPEGYRVIRWEADFDTITVYIEPLRTERFTFTMPEDGEPSTAGCPGHPHDSEQF